MLSFREKRWFRCFWGPSFGHFDWRLLHWCDQRRRGPYLSPTKKKSPRFFSGLSAAVPHGLQVHKAWQGYNSRRWDFLSQQRNNYSQPTEKPNFIQGKMFLPSWERSGCHFKLTKKTSISYSLPQTIRTHENPWLKDARSKKTYDSPKRWGNMVVVHWKANLGIWKVHHGTIFFLLQKKKR